MLTLINISKEYDKRKVLCNCSFEIGENTCAGLIGPNGAGKSTLLKIILGIISATDGKILYFDNQELNNSVKQKIGFFLGVDFLPEEMTGKTFLKFISAIYQSSGREIESKILSLTNYFFEDDSFLNAPIKKYSLGMRQKLGICSSLIMNPKLLILDEPFVGLDSFSCVNLIKFLNKYKESNSIIVSSHDLHYLEKICNTVLLIEDCNIVYNGEVNEFTNSYKSSFEEVISERLIHKPKEIELLNWLF